MLEMMLMIDVMRQKMTEISKIEVTKRYIKKILQEKLCERGGSYWV